MMKRHRYTHVIFWLVSMWLISAPALSQLSDAQLSDAHPSESPKRGATGRAPNFPRVMLIVFEENNTEVLRVVENLQLRLFEMDIKFGIRWIKLADPSVDQQTDIARSLMAAENLQLVFFWNPGSRDRLYFLDTSAASPISRRINDVGEESRPEAISIVVQTTIESLIDSEALVSPKFDSSPREARPNQTVVPPVPAPRQSALLPRHKRAGRFYLQGGYELDSLNSQPTLLHTVNLRLGYQPVPVLRTYVGVGISSHLFSRENGFEVRQSRLPIEIGGLAMFERSALVVGGGAAFLIVPEKNSPGATADSAYMKKSYWSQGVMGRIFFECQYRISRHFEFYADVHLLININSVTYSIENGPILFDEFRRLWPGFQAGITFFLF